MAVQSIPASRIVSVVPSVIGTGGNPLAMNTVITIEAILGKPRVIGVREFGSATEVGAFFGLNSDEYSFAQRYFRGYTGATKLPTSLHIVENREDGQPAVLQSASFRGVSIDDIKQTGTLTIVIDGVSVTSTVDLTLVTSFSDAASVISLAFPTLSYAAFDPSSQTFELYGKNNDPTGTISFASGTMSSTLRLNEESGALAQDAYGAMTFSQLMSYVTSQTLNFAVIAPLREIDIDSKKEAATWNSLQNSRFLLVMQDTSGAATTPNNSASFGSWLTETEQDGTMAYYGTIEQIAALCGGIASIDFKRVNGRRNIMFMRQAGITASVTSESDYTALISNGYTFYAAFATANDRFQFQTNGSVAGEFRWADSYVNQIYLNSQLQLALITMLESYGSIPYNEVGKSYHRSAVLDPINEMLNFGGIQPLLDPAALSDQQKSIINSIVGRDVIADLINKGYVIDIKTADAQIRGLRGSMPFTLIYTDGGSVQTVNLASINVQ